MRLEKELGGGGWPAFHMGRGPRARWTGAGGAAQADLPACAAPARASQGSRSRIRAAGPDSSSASIPWPVLPYRPLDITRRGPTGRSHARCAPSWSGSTLLRQTEPSTNRRHEVVMPGMFRIQQAE